MENTAHKAFIANKVRMDYGRFRYRLVLQLQWHGLRQRTRRRR